MKHLGPDELIDAVDQTLAGDRRAHLAGCDRCRSEVRKLSALLGDVRTTAVPEPSPLFWEHFSSRVRTRIAGDPFAPTRFERWFEWPVLVPVAGLALLVLALVTAVPNGARPTIGRQLAEQARLGEPSAPSTTSAAESWDLLAALVGEVDIDTATEAGFGATPGAADSAVWQLTSAEQLELARLLREELERSGG